jgi:hypothetical protein
MSDAALLPLLFYKLNDSYERLRSRLVGLSDQEYLWEPVAGMWSVREVDGRWVVEDDPEAPAPTPVTTIAWRMWHIASSCLAQYISHLGPWPLEVERDEWYPDATSAIAALETSWRAFHERIHALGEVGLRSALGPSWGPFAENSWAELVTHAADELAHHGAEIALLRDLYPHFAANRVRPGA